MFGFRRRVKAEPPTQELSIRVLDAMKDCTRTQINSAVGGMAEHLRNEMETLRSLVHDAQDEVGEIRQNFKGFEQTVHAEVRTLCQNAAEAARAIADTMDMLRPTLMKIRERNLKKEVAEKCQKE